MKRNLLILLTSTLLLSFTLTGCGSETITINVENKNDIHNTTFGKDTLTYIGNQVYYDSATRIVYWWNGRLSVQDWSTTPSPYYAPNGLPYKYNPETNTFEEINLSELLNN